MTDDFWSKVAANAAIAVKRMSARITGLAVLAAGWWLGLDDAQQATKLAQYPRLIPWAAYLTPIAIAVSFVWPQPKVTAAVLRQADKLASDRADEQRKDRDDA